MSGRPDARYFVERRRPGRDWEVISEREFTGRSDDSERRMAPRSAEECARYVQRYVERGEDAQRMVVA